MKERVASGSGLEVKKEYWIREGCDGGVRAKW